MAKPLTADQFRNIASRLKARGYTVKFYPGWETRGRPYSFGPINGFVWHHTGSSGQSDSYLKFLFVDGRPGIPGPLCQFAVRDNGEIWIGATGRANHAGKGSSRTLNTVIGESYDGYNKEISPGSDDMDGNTRYLGVEIMYSGSNEMSSAQYNAAVSLGAEVMREYGDGWTALSCIGHREHSGRKWDPGSHKLYTMRRDARTVLQGGTLGMTVDKKFVEDFANQDDVFDAPKEAATFDKNPKWMLRTVLRYILNNVYGSGMARNVWKEDHVIDAPPSYVAEKPDNPHWYGARHLTEQSEAVLYTIPAQVEKLRGTVEAALAASQGAGTDEILARIDAMAVEATAQRAGLEEALGEASASLSAVHTLLTNFQEGTVDEANLATELLRQFGKLVSEAS